MKQNFERLTVRQVATMMVDQAGDIQVPQRPRINRLRHPFPHLNGSSTSRATLINREERRLYRAIEAGELSCYRDDTNPRSTIYLRWNDVREWHRKKNPLARAVNA